LIQIWHRGKHARYFNPKIYQEAEAEAKKANRGMWVPFVPQRAEPVWHLFAVRHQQRDNLQKFLTKCNVGTLIHYPVLPHLSKAYAEQGWKLGDYPISEKIADTMLSLPIGPHLTENMQAEVVSKLKAFFKKKSR
jgi:dTDP-4-amino-4,6-dideoxygalactose transaminase